MPQPPRGMVTFLFTDIEGSTCHWEHHPAQSYDTTKCIDWSGGADHGCRKLAAAQRYPAADAKRPRWRRQDPPGATGHRGSVAPLRRWGLVYRSCADQRSIIGWGDDRRGI